ncbi:DUF2164 domain-containing protein [Pelagicoccus mobilis]
MELSKEEEKAAVESIQQYLSDEYGVDSSDLKTKLLMEFFLKEIGPFAYNKGVGDAEAFMRARLEDLSGSCFEHPMTHWER